jgi:hypothetical protein
MTDPDSVQPPSAVTEDRRKHLDFIQAALSRMSSSSSTAKGWLLPVVTATYGYAATQRAAEVALLGMAAVGLFTFLDAHYLRQERAFRALYRAAVAGTVPVYEMSNAPYFRKPSGDDDDPRAENCTWSAVIKSWSLGGFYGPLLLVGLIVLGRALW